MLDHSYCNESDCLLNNICPLFGINNNDNIFGLNPLDSFQLNDSNNTINGCQKINLLMDPKFFLGDLLKEKNSDSFDLIDVLILEDLKNKNQIANKEANFKTKSTKTHDNDNKKNMNNDVNINMINKDNNIAILIQKIDEKTNKSYKKEAIFDIQKIKKKGRIPKNATNFKGKHNKMTDDNIIRKIKAKFYNNIVDYINILYEKSSKKIKQYSKEIRFTKFLQKIISSESKVIKKKDNLNWFSLKIKDILSAKISSKFTKYRSNYNKKNIERVYKDNKLKDLIEVLEKSVRNVYYDYCHDIKAEGLKTLENDINEIREEMKNDEEEEIDEYSVKFKEIALNLEKKFRKKRDRRNR